MTSEHSGEPRRVSFAQVDWQPDDPSAPDRAAQSESGAKKSRPSALRSISFAHIRRPSSTPRRPVPPRSQSFCDTRWELQGPNLALRQGSVAGPFAFLNPTTAIFDIRGGDSNSLYDITDPERGERARIRWNAREFRKGWCLICCTCLVEQNRPVPS